MRAWLVRAHYCEDQQQRSIQIQCKQALSVGSYSGCDATAPASGTMALAHFQTIVRLVCDVICRLLGMDGLS
jgi:hypothetical protein